MSTSTRWIVIVLLSCIIVHLGWMNSARAAMQRKPNILFIVADDMQRNAIAALGNPHIKTPNLDLLVQRGTSLTRAYVMGALHGAVCMPSRAMLLSGRSLWRVPENLQGVVTLGELLQAAGYITFGTGKWHNGEASFARTFELDDAVMFGGMSDHFNVPLARRNQKGKFDHYTAPGKHSSEIFADAAIQFLTKHIGKDNPSGKPFFLYIAFTAPHDPRDAPTKYREMYYKNRPPLPPNFMPQHPFDNGNLVLRDEVLAPWPRTKEIIRDQLAEYYALITHMDEQIGRILQALRDIGEYQNTIIIFSADNGLAVGSHGLLGKQNLYEHSVGVPLVFSGPGIPQGQTRDALVYLFDIFPTICDMTGLRAPDGIDGKSLQGVIQGSQKRVRDSIYNVHRDHQRSVRDDRYALICYPKINHVQLFDLQADPHQLKNLADAPEHTQRIAQMKQMILQWEAKLGAPQQPLTVMNPSPSHIDLSGRQRLPDRWQPQWIRNKYFEK